ncbi:MAG TPA: NUDIX hydrolase [Chloroflexota bacterium]
MTDTIEPPGEERWLEWAKRLQAAAQNGLAYNSDPFNVERYTAIRQIAEEMLNTYSDVEHRYLTDLFDAQVGHATPKIDVRGVVFRDDGVLLVKERSDGRWALPGGWADVYDTPSQATVREIFEEAGFRTRATKLLALLDRTRQGHPPIPFHAYKAFFLCEIVAGEAATSIETAEVDFFELNNLPPLSLGRVTPAQIHRFFAHREHPEWPADFD